MLDGIGVFGIILGQDFAHSGFMHSSLYLLLRNLISSSAQIRIASDAVLRTLAAAGGYSTVIDDLSSCKILLLSSSELPFMFFFLCRLANSLWRMQITLSTLFADNCAI